MCGLGVIVDRDAFQSEAVRRQLDLIGEIQGHRGPDGRAVWLAPASRNDIGRPMPTVGLCHQRLSIIDLSAAADQPFESPCGRYVLVYNGEIYNYRELARELRGHAIAGPVLAKSSGDTAVLLGAIMAWGVRQALSRLNGMWAFSLFDREQQALYLSRDRLGIKPLYIRFNNERLTAASEVKSIVVATGERFSPNARAAARYLLLGLADQERDTFFEGIRSVAPGSYIKFDLAGDWPTAIEEIPYWVHPFERGDPVRKVSDEEMRQVFFDAVRIHLRSDVPLGIMLSGGLDSTSLVAAARRIDPDAKISALSVVSNDLESNEEEYIDLAARELGIDTHKFTIDLDPRRLPKDIATFSWHADAPLKSLTSVGLAQTCKLARESGLTVLLSGQGADEQLAGYDKFLYFHLIDMLRCFDLAGAVGEAARFALNRSVFPNFSLVEAKRYVPMLLKRFSSMLSHGAKHSGWEISSTHRSFRQREFDDLMRFSVPTLLEDEDRMSMSASTEMRVPFLDVNLVELLAVTPASQKLAHGWTKAIFRNALGPFLPSKIAWRRDKRGFTVPHRKLLVGPLRTVIEETFSSEMISANAGLIDADKIKSAFREYVDGSRRVSDREMFRYWAIELWARKFEPYLTH